MSERPANNPPRDLAMPERILRSALSLVDRINPFLAASQPAELEFEALDRIGQVAGFAAMRAAMEPGMNARRRAEWRARFGGTEAVPPLMPVAVKLSKADRAILASDPQIRHLTPGLDGFLELRRAGVREGR